MANAYVNIEVCHVRTPASLLFVLCFSALAFAACADDEKSGDQKAGFEADSGGSDASGGSDTGNNTPDTNTNPGDTGGDDTGGGQDTSPPEDAGQDTSPDVPDEPDVPVGPDPNDGWIGGPCTSSADCEFADATCLNSGEGFPGGMCSQPCDRYCPDQEGNSVTFCIDGGYDGTCFARCDSDLYPGSGCRDGYKCQINPRYGEASVTQGVCVPDSWSTPGGDTECLQQLDALGVPWSAWAYSTQTASGQSCTIEDPVTLHHTINGVTWRYFSSETAGSMRGACALGLALHRMGDLLQEFNIREVEHIGTFNCRVIAGTSTLSAHSFGAAIDIKGVITNTGDHYDLEQDWEHDTTTPQTTAASVLYELGQRMHEDRIFNIVLTPNYNSAHDNHFHVDLTPGSYYIGAEESGDYWIGNDRDLCTGYAPEDDDFNYAEERPKP